MTTRNRWKTAAATAAAAVAGAGGVWAVQDGVASTRAESPRVAGTVPCKPPGGFFFGSNLVRADIALVVQGSLHLFRVERGRLVKPVGVDSITVRERDGSVVDIPVSPSAFVRINNRPATLTALKRRHVVTTIRDGDSPASCVLASTQR